MKILGIRQDFGPVGRELPEVVLTTDSSLLTARKPFFVPEFAERFVARPCLVARVSRLGKNVARRFASRYYDAFALGMAVEAEGLRESFGEAGAGAIANAFDGAAIVGDFAATAVLGERLTATVCGDTLLDCPMAEAQAVTDAAIEYVSRYFMLKMGDMIFVSHIGPLRELIPETVVQGTLNGSELLHFKVK